MDGLTTKLQEVEEARDDALKGIANYEAAAEELKCIFTISKAILEKAKAKVEVDLAKTSTTVT